MFVMIDKKSPFFDKERALTSFNDNKSNLDDINGFDNLFANSMFWNVYNNGYVGSVFIYQNEKDNNYYLGGYAGRKRHKDCVEAVKRAADCLSIVYADTRHLNAVMCLLEAGFEWVDRKKRLLRRIRNEQRQQSKITDL